jgi:hypothetical protein
VVVVILVLGLVEFARIAFDGTKSLKMEKSEMCDNVVEFLVRGSRGPLGRIA